MSSISFFLFQISHFSWADLCESFHPSREFPSIQRSRRWSAWSWRSYQTATTTTMLLLPLWRRGSFLHLFLYVDAKQLDWMKPIRAWWPPGQRLISCKGRSLSELPDFFGHSLASHWVWMLLAWRREILSSLHLPCLPNCILPLGLSSCISGLPLDLNLRDINTPVSAATANDDEYVSSRLQELPGIKCSFLSDCECTFSGFCFLDSFRAQPEKDAFLPQKSDGSKTPQFTDVSLSCVHRPQYVVFLVFFSHVLGMQVVREVGGGGGYRKPPWPSVY